jgi:HEAT repeat protein
MQYALLLVGLVLGCSSLAHAHGGQYRGPSDVKPPSSSGSTGGSGNTTKSGGSPAGGTAGATSPSSGNTATGPAAGAAAGTVNRNRGMAIDEDPTRWEFWWEFGKDPYVQIDRLRGGAARAVLQPGADDTLLNPRLRARTPDALPPTADDLDALAVHLVRILRSKPSRDIVSASLVALAKIGRDQPNAALFDVIAPFLRSADQEERETAALALGIAGQIRHQATLDLLLALLGDQEAGRAACARASVDDRTRAFAAFALGLWLARQPQAATAHRIVDALCQRVANHTSAAREITVAAIEALAQLPPDWDGPAAAALRDLACRQLLAFYELPLGPGEQLVQAHVPTALARLASGPTRALWRDRCARDLEHSLQRDSRLAKTSIHIPQSCALALGELAGPWHDRTSPDHTIGELLLEVYRRHHDVQTRSFALLALARLGGTLAKERLLEAFAAGNRAYEKPWAGVALGVLYDREQRRDASLTADPELLAALRAEFVQTKNPGALGGLAVALGLAQDRQAADALRAALHDNRHRDEVVGYLGIGLALMRDERAIGPLRQLLEESARRPAVTLQAARALGMLGDTGVVEVLCAKLRSGDQSVVRIAALASALGQIGDRRSLQPLLAIANDEQAPLLSRAFAVVALGGVGDKDPLPWNANYATLTNYRAATSTLTDGGAGILDIL